MPDGDDPYRAGSAHSETLTRLASRHPEAGAIHEALAVTDTDDAVALAIGRSAPVGCLLMMAYPATAGLVIAWMLGAMPALAIVAGVGAIVVAHATHTLAGRRWQRQIGRALDWQQRLPFTMHNTTAFFAATRPMIDVTFTRPPSIADYAAGVRGHTAGATALAIDAHTFRVELPGPPAPRVDVSWLRRFTDEVLVPLHRELGIERVQLGGATRALPAATPPART